VLLSELLKTKHTYRWVDPVIKQNATIRETIVTAIEGGLSAMMVLDPSNDHVVGLLTTRDMSRIMAMGIKEGEDSDHVMNRTIGDYMTPITQVIYGRPDETIGIARTLMAKLRIKCLPILSKDGKVEGLVTARDMEDFGMNAKERGGKRAYLTDVSERVGMNRNTSMAEPPTYLKAHLALKQQPLFMNIAQAALPHPFKTPTGTGGSRRGKNILYLFCLLETTNTVSFRGFFVCSCS
jgi:CBS domain-containing protein